MLGRTQSHTLVRKVDVEYILTFILRSDCGIRKTDEKQIDLTFDRICHKPKETERKTLEHFLIRQLVQLVKMSSAISL